LRLVVFAVIFSRATAKRSSYSKMSNSIEIPNILNEVARAGQDGHLLSADPDSTATLELCRKWGFPLKFENGRAFLLYDEDALVPEWIENEARVLVWDKINVRGFLETGSTNEEALSQAHRGAAGGTLIYAERQTAGRGRKGRSWISPAGGGIYCTLILRPRQPQRHWPLLTHAASVALAHSLKEILEIYAPAHPITVDLKWPNDVLLSGKKTAGILLETIAVQDESRTAVVGVGINVRQGSVPEALKDQATCLDLEAGAEVPRRRLLVRFLYHLQLCYDLFERGGYRELLERWKSCSSMWNGVPVWIDDSGQRSAAVTCGLTDLGALRIRRTNGMEETLLAGDVSVRRA